MSDKMSDLKLCPFCGGEAEVLEYYLKGVANKKHFFCQCKSCGTRKKNWTGYASRRNAITAWNTRKPFERIKERIIDATDNLTSTGVFGVETEFILEILKEEGGFND